MWPEQIIKKCSTTFNCLFICHRIEPKKIHIDPKEKKKICHASTIVCHRVGSGKFIKLKCLTVVHIYKVNALREKERALRIRFRSNIDNEQIWWCEKKFVLVCVRNICIHFPYSIVDNFLCVQLNVCHSRHCQKK